jgi:hypothetical protein
MTNRYSEVPFSNLELSAIEWLDGFYQLEHLLCTRVWVTKLYPGASAELKFAALVHDAERFFPGGPTSMPSDGFDNCDYLFAHSIRSADIVEAWLNQEMQSPVKVCKKKVRNLIMRHEIGGNSEEDILQAADSLSFLDIYDWLVTEWVRKGHYSHDQAREKLDWSVERIRLPTARRFAMPLYTKALKALESAHSSDLDIVSHRAAASNPKILLN